MPGPKVSIIVPIYNVEQYLRACIDSVLTQPFADYELILVDDGSPDRCPEICDEYAEKDSRIRVIHKKNGGLSDARNAGLDSATGKYIYFLDSDDLIESDLLSNVVEQMDQGLDLVAFQFYHLLPDGIKLNCCFPECCSFELTDEDQRRDFIINALLSGKIKWEAWSRMFLREKIEKYNLRFADNRKIFAEDLYFSLCYCAHAEKIRCMDAFLYNYRIRDDSIMGVQKKKINVGRINELAKEVCAYYRRFDDCRGLVDDFDIIYTQIIMGQFIHQLWQLDDMDPMLFRDKVRESVEDWEELEKNLKSFLRRRDLARKLDSSAWAMELKSNTRFLLGGSWTKLRIQCRLIHLMHPIFDKLDMLFIKR